MQYFHELPIGQTFRCNETVYVKCSTRTAVRFGESRSHYFRQKETCTPVSSPKKPQVSNAIFRAALFGSLSFLMTGEHSLIIRRDGFTFTCCYLPEAKEFKVTATKADSFFAQFFRDSLSLTVEKIMEVLASS